MRLTIFLAMAMTGACRKPAPPPVSTECVACHQAQVESVGRSHHARAQEALGRPLPSAQVGGFNVTSDDGGSWLEWADDGGVRRGQVRYLIGVEPLRQLVVESGNGLHVPPIGWLSDGGWAIVPIPEGDSFDWRGPAYSWNGSCAPCHATQFQAGLEADGGFSSRFSSFAVSCRACHGDEADHLRWLSKGRPSVDAAGFSFSLRHRRTITFLDAGATARLDAPRPDVQTEVCAACHARRRPLTGGGTVSAHFLDLFEPSLIEDGVYSSAGEVRDEVFEVGSFLQSRMHAAGVRCADCHDAHEGSLRQPPPALCGRCHRLEVFDSPSHHGHRTVGCVDCHLPKVTFLGVDVRHDHSLARPTKEVCAGCHVSVPKSALPLRSGEAFAAAFGDRLDAPRRLDALIRDGTVSSFARASAVAARRWSRDELGVLRAQASSSDEWVRYGVARALKNVAPQLRAELGALLVGDERRAVRVEAGRAVVGLVPLPPELLHELEEAEAANAFRGDAWLNSSVLREQLGDRARAEEALREGLRRDPAFVPLLVNLADLRRAEAVHLLEPAARRPGPFQTEASFALALALWRDKEPVRARAAFAAAARDGQPLHLVNWCLSERTLGGREQGWATWDAALRKRPGNRDLLELAEGWLRDEPDAERQKRVDAERSHWNP